MAINCIKKAFMFSFVLKSVHHPERQPFFGFSWRDGNSNCVNCYAFTVLPFGLWTAPHIFFKLFKPLEKHPRLQNIGNAIFVDAGWGKGSRLGILSIFGLNCLSRFDKSRFCCQWEKNQCGILLKARLVAY